MQQLRHARFLARLVLVWFALAIGVAVAAPIVKPQSMELICSGTGAFKLLVKGDDGTQALASHTLDCPLCATGGAPPPTAVVVPSMPQPLGYAAQSIPSARIAVLTAAPLPARGPPGAPLVR
jgi:hypothetical protein